MASTWLNGYRPGSFRGVPFFITGHQLTSGRKQVEHDFPEKDGASYEDQGRKARSFSFPAYITGDNYFQDRENLVAALEQKGPGRLVHPYRGTFTVVVDGFTLSESTDEGRVARFDITFAEDVAEELTIVRTNTTAAVLVARKNLLTKLLDALALAYNVAGAPASLLEKVADTVDQGLAVLVAAKKTASAVADFQRQVSNLKGKLVELVLDAKSLGQELQNVIAFGTDAASRVNPATSVDALKQTYEMLNTAAFRDAQVGNTPPAVQQAPTDPAGQVQNYQASVAVAAAGGLMATVEFDSVEQAEELRDTVFAQLDRIQQDPNTDDGVFEACQQLRAAIQDDLRRRILSLAQIVEYTLPEDAPVLVVSNTVYGGISQEEEILQRNGVRHPGFCSAAGPLRIRVEA